MSRKAAIYARVSTDQQAEKGYSLDTQLSACRKSAKELGADLIIEYVDDGYSGEYIERPAMERLRNAIKDKEFDIVIVYDPDRLARNLAHQLIITEEIEKSGAQLKFVSVTFEQSPEGKLFYSIRGAVSAYEKEKIKERTMRGKKGKLQSGKLIFNSAPYGYDWDSENNTYILNEQQAEVVRLIYKLCIDEGLGSRAIANRLNEMAIPSAKNGKWKPGTIYKLLVKETYYGVHQGMKYYYKKTGLNEEKRIKRDPSEWIPVSVPAIIDEDTWQAAQKQLQVNKSLSKRNTKHTYILQHILYCGRCKQHMSVVYSGPKRIDFYWCRSRINNFLDSKGCGSRMIKVSVLEDTIWGFVSGLCKSKRKLESYLKRTSPQKEDNSPALSNLKRLNEQEKKLIKQRETIMKWFDRQMITEEEADPQLLKIKDQMEQIQQARIRTQSVLNLDAPKLTSDEIISIYKSDIPDNPTQEDKQKFLKKVIDKVFVERIDANWRINTELDFSILFR